MHGGWPNIRPYNMPRHDQLISIFGLFGCLTFFIVSSTIVYCTILRTRGMAGNNQINIESQGSVPNFAPTLNIVHTKSEINTSVASQISGFTHEERLEQEKRRQAEIRASILSLKTNLILTFIFLAFAFIAGLVIGPLSNVLLSIVKTWTPIITMIVNFQLIRNAIDNFFSSLKKALSKKIIYLMRIFSWKKNLNDTYRMEFTTR